MIWYILLGVCSFLLGMIIGVNAGNRVTIKDNFVGYYDVGMSGKVFFDPKVKPEDIYEKEFIVLECVDLSKVINANKEN